MFVVKEGVQDFRAIVEVLEAQGEGPARVESMARAYASVLERVARQYPDQWFNFYDFWAA